MGDNRELSWELGLPRDTICPKCRATIHDPYDDYDVECGSPNLKRGVWVLNLFCGDCQTQWTEEYELHSVLIIKREFGK